MFVDRLVQIESNVDVAVQCLYYYCSQIAIDLFDKVSDLKTEQSYVSNRQKGFLFSCSSYAQNNNRPPSQRKNKKKKKDGK